MKAGLAIYGHPIRLYPGLLFFFGLLLVFSCTPDGDKAEESPFDKTKWGEKQGDNYLYREAMLNGILYNDSIRELREEKIMELLGKPDRRNGEYLYYEISRRRLLGWTLHAKTMVVKMKADKSVDWIKVHQ
ncbi:hypothetical protein [Robiginitalea sp. IMCC43444]|uniref:hypothetical protein n=1 Tax=Robiginitalea sp. IMCC43444 TaxID=3459121 RepID=UPI0040436F41